MAELEDLQGTMTLREAWPKVEKNDQALNAELAALDQRVDNIVADAGSSNTEIVDARQPASGPAFPVLKDRLDDSDARIAAHLADFEQFVEKSAIVSDSTYGNGIQPGELITFDYLRKRQSFLFADFYRKLRKNQAVTICGLGDSYMYGHDTVSADKRPADPTPCPDGSTHTATRASITITEALSNFLNQLYPGKVTVINRGFSGDGAKLAYNRWITPSGANMTVINLGTNDSKNSWIDYAGNVEEFLNWYEKLIAREIVRGSAVIILTPPKQRNPVDMDIDTFANSLFLLGGRFGVPVIETDEWTENYSTDIYSDGIHFNGKGYNIYGARLASLFVGEGCHKPRFVADGSRVLARQTIDNIVFSGSAYQLSTTDSFTPAEAVENNNIIANIEHGGSVTYSFYSEIEDLLVVPVVRMNANARLTVELDFGVEQPDYSLDATLYKDPSFTDKPASSFQYTTTSSLMYYNSTKFDFLNGDNRFIHIATRGWHTLRIKVEKTTEAYTNVILDGIEFFSYFSMKVRKQAEAQGYYKGLTHSDLSDNSNVTQTVINLMPLLLALKLEKFTQYWRGVPLKLTVYNYDQSILEYKFLFGDPSDGAGFTFVPTPVRTNITEPPTSERTCTGITFNASTQQLTIAWGGATTRPTAFTISVL